MAVDFPRHPTHRIAKNSDGCAVVLVHTRDDAPGTSIPFRTEYLHVSSALPYRIRYQSRDPREEVFTAITCLSLDPAFIRYFLGIVANLLDSLGSSPTANEVAAVVQTIVQLFRALTLPPSTSLQGLWAELFLISRSRDKAVVARAWHATPDERYDFVRALDRVDVKSSGRRERRHHFSLEQVSPAPAAHFWIASLFVERAGGGTSLEAVLNEACNGLAPEEAATIRRRAAESLGLGFANALEVSFDASLAEASVRYYASDAIPRPTGLPVEITDVRYVADLSHTLPIEASTVEPSGLLAALPSAGDFNR
jgi:hypothetical protein